MLAYRRGLREGIPIGLGYLAVSFSLGIAAKNAGVTPLQGFLASLFTIASAGENAGFTVIGEKASYAVMALIILVANCRYILMSCALSQRTDPAMKNIHRIFVGSFITDEIFASTIRRPGYLKPAYVYGLASTSVLPWAVGTCLGILVGNLLPAFIVRALSVMLYGMFIAIIIPPARKSRLIAVLIAVCFALSFVWQYIPGLSTLSEGLKIVILTVLIAGAAAVLFPHREEEKAGE